MASPFLGALSAMQIRKRCSAGPSPEPEEPRGRSGTRPGGSSEPWVPGKLEEHPAAPFRSGKWLRLPCLQPACCLAVKGFTSNLSHYFPFILLLSSYSFFRLSLTGVKKSVFSLLLSSEVMNPFEVMDAYCPLLGDRRQVAFLQCYQVLTLGKGLLCKEPRGAGCSVLLSSGCAWCVGWETGIIQH